MLESGYNGCGTDDHSKCSASCLRFTKDEASVCGGGETMSLSIYVGIDVACVRKSVWFES